MAPYAGGAAGKRLCAAGARGTAGTVPAARGVAGRELRMPPLPWQTAIREAVRSLQARMLDGRHPE
jgi:hypothetical protein